jgi:AcrR family transcriptional regulator
MGRASASRRAHRTARRGPGRPAGRTATDGVIADRDALLEAAERRIRDHGPVVSLEAIAAEAGVTKPILYRSVGDKDALVLALAQRLAGRMADDVARLVATASTPLDGLRSLVGGYLRHAARDRHLYLYVTAGGASDDRVRQSLLLADDAASQFAASIESYRSARGADPTVATVWAYGMVGALHFVTLWWLRDQAVDVERVTDQITALMWSGLDLDQEPRPAPEPSMRRKPR